MSLKKSRIPFGQIDGDKKDAVFLAIYSKEISPWKYFKDNAKDVVCPGLIMIDRWDGRMGFPGGVAQKDESLKEALKREIKEEIGLTISTNKVHGIASHEWRLRTHLFGLEVNELEFMHIYYHILNSFARSTLLQAYDESDASRFLSETTGIKIVPIVRHHNKGINLFIANNFAGSAANELKILIEEIFEIKNAYM